jgi:hypothetical protein
MPRVIGFCEVLGKSLIVVCALAAAAHGQPTRVETDTSHPVPPAPPPPPAPAVAPAPVSPPDPAAEEAASEANLESIAPRAGMTFSGSVGGGLTMGDGVGRGPAASFRVGRVATPTTVLTFELTGGSLLHQMDTKGSPIQHNDLFSVMAGGLHYVNSSLWIRGAGGLSVYTTDNTPAEPKPAHPGVGGLFGVGIDLARWHYLVLGLETYGQMAVISTRGLMFNSGLCLGLTYY